MRVSECSGAAYITFPVAPEAGSTDLLQYAPRCVRLSVFLEPILDAPGRGTLQLQG